MKKYLLSCLLCFFTLVPFYGQRVLFPTPSSYTQDKGNCNIGRWQVFQEQEMKPFS